MTTPTKTWAVTGPTSGIGHATALALAPHGHVVLVGRNAAKLDAVRTEIEAAGGRASTVIADMADLPSIHRAAQELGEMPLDGILFNAGVRLPDDVRTADGHNATVMTNFIGPFAFTEALRGHLADGTNLVYTVSAVEDAARRPAAMAGFRGGRYLSADDALAGRWAPGGSTKPGFDAYATGKQALLASVLAFAREDGVLRYNAVEPGIIPGTGLEGELAAPARAIITHVVPRVVGRVPYLSTTDRAAKVMVQVLTSEPGTGGYFDEHGEQMYPSAQVQEPGFGDTVVRQTRSLLARL